MIYLLRGLGERSFAPVELLATDAWRVDEAWIDWTEEQGRFPRDHRFVGAALTPGP